MRKETMEGSAFTKSIEDEKTGERSQHTRRQVQEIDEMTKMNHKEITITENKQKIGRCGEP